MNSSIFFHQFLAHLRWAAAGGGNFARQRKAEFAVRTDQHFRIQFGLMPDRDL